MCGRAEWPDGSVHLPAAVVGRTVRGYRYGMSGPDAAEWTGRGPRIGELALLDRGPRTASVTADVDSTVLVIDQRHFTPILDEVPTLAHKILAGLAGKIRDLDRQYYG